MKLASFVKKYHSAHTKHPHASTGVKPHGAAKTTRTTVKAKAKKQATYAPHPIFSAK